MYAWGQVDPLNITVFPDDNEFTLTSLTPGEYYQLSFDYDLKCTPDSSFSFGLYEIMDAWYYDNTTGTSVYGETYVELWIINDETNSDETVNTTVTYKFMAESSEHNFIFKTNGMTSSSSCFEEIEYDYIINTCLDEALDGDMYCTDIDYSSDLE